MPNPTRIGSKAIGIRTASSKIPVVEHVALNRSAYRVNALTNMGYCTMQVRSVGMTRNITT